LSIETFKQHAKQSPPDYNHEWRRLADCGWSGLGARAAKAELYSKGKV
jgi:hypothetical protein